MKVKLGKKFFSNIGPDVVNLYREHTFDDGLDSNGKKFKKYSKEYGEAKRANKFKKQVSKFKNTTSPVLTGDLYRDFKLIKTSRDGIIGGTVAHGAKVDSLAKRGRYLSTTKNPIPKHIGEFILKEADEYFMKQVAKVMKNKTFKIDVFKK